MSYPLNENRMNELKNNYIIMHNTS